MSALFSLLVSSAILAGSITAEDPGWTERPAVEASEPHRSETSCDYENPHIGTRDMGHTYPGATVPFGMVQLSPDTDSLLYSYGDGYNRAIYRYCAGYQYDDETIVGFSYW